MRPVARIAQSVEQGIENPRVPGSIPGSGTIFKEPASGGFLHFCGSNPFIERSMISPHPCGSPYGPSRRRAEQKCSRHFCPGSGTLFKEPASGGFLRLEPIFDHSLCQKSTHTAPASADFTHCSTQRTPIKPAWTSGYQKSCRKALSPRSVASMACAKR